MMMTAVARGRLARLLVLLCLAGCAGLPPGSGYPKRISTTWPLPDATRVGQHFALQARPQGGRSALRLLSAGIDGFLTRVQMIDAAEQTVDLAYYIFRQDQTGQLLSEALLHAADRGVRVRLLVDDGDTLAGDERIVALGGHLNVEVRVFNPFWYRGHLEPLRALEFAFNAARLDYRMHNKLMVVDNAMALLGGRNIGDQYFQVDPASRFGDDDVFVAGPVVGALSRTFDEFWNSDLAIPAPALDGSSGGPLALADYRARLAAHHQTVRASGADHAGEVASGEPLAGMLDGRLPLAWAQVQVVFDSPDKKRVQNREMVGALMHRQVAQAVAQVQNELLMVTPYFIPGEDGMRLLEGLRQRDAAVRILTNSLESTPENLAQAGYMRYRVALLEQGIELHEVRATPGNARGTGESAAAARSGHYALHAKLFVFDRKRLYVGSMNFDQRSHHLNTEVGLIIDSPELAEQTARRFQSIVALANSYAPVLRADPMSGQRNLHWQTEEGGRMVEHAQEPARSTWQRFKVQLLRWLPLDDEL